MTGSRALAVVFALSLSVAAFAQEPLEEARRLFLNLHNGLYIKGVEVAAAPAGVEAPWAIRVTWEQAPGCPDWGCVTSGFRADSADGYSFDLLAESAIGEANVSAYLVESDGDRWVEAFSLAGMAGKGWHHVDLRGEGLRLWQFGNGKRERDTIGSLVLEPSGHETKAVFWIANLRLHTKSGTRDILPLMAEADCPPVTGVSPAIRLPAMPRCYMGTGVDFIAKPEGVEFIRRIHQRIPNLGVAANGAAGALEWREAVESLRREGIDVRVQNGGIDGMRGLITRAQAWGVSPQGRSRNTEPGFENGTHGVSYCHPAAREAVRRMMGWARGLGLLDYEQVDYVWPWFGGPWGYGEWDLEAFRTDLQGLDEGLRQASGTLALRVRGGFWEYLAAYGIEGLEPGDLGLTAWEQFSPKPREGETADQAARRGQVFVALTHYEWLKFGQAMGAEARSWGGQFLATMNPEDVSNGGDYVFWNRLADTGTAYIERFGNPGDTEYWRHYVPYLREEATRSGKRFGVIYEVGVGGHGKPYLDSEVAYCMSYDHTASGQFDDMQNEWMSETAEVTAEGYHGDRLANWLATAEGFNRAKADEARLPQVKALAIGQRCVVHCIGITPSYLLTRGALNDLNVDCDYADLTMDAERWERYDVLIYGPWESSRRHLEALPRWLDAKPGRLLITHGAVPTRIADGRGYAPSAEVGDGSLGALLGLGRIGMRTVAAAGPPHPGPLPPTGGEGARPAVLYTTSEGTALVSVGGDALVNEARRANGSRVVYLNYAAGQPETRELDGRIIRGLLGSVPGCSSRVVAPDGDYCHLYPVRGGEVAVLWSRAACEAFKFEYRGDIEQRMPYRDGKASAKADVSVPAGRYRLLDFLAREERVVEVGADGRLSLAAEGLPCGLMYFGPDGPEWQVEVARLKGLPVPWAL